MTIRYTVSLVDESTCQVDADGFRISEAGALSFSVIENNAPRPIFALHPKAWKWCCSADAGVSFSSPAWGGAASTTPAAPAPKLIPATEIPDQFRRQ
jgi:hypothetical protein